MDEGHPRRRAEDLNWWGRLPMWAKGLAALTAVWAAGWSSAIVAQEYAGVPRILEDHEERIAALEQARDNAVERSNRNLIYVGCRLDEMATGNTGSRCELVLDDQTRSLLRQLSTP